MKLLISIILVVLIMVIVLVLKGRKNPGSVLRSSAPAGSRTTARVTGNAGGRVTLEQKLEVLASCGLRLSEPFTATDLLTSWDREEFEKPGFNLVLVGLGMAEEKAPWRNHCANLWHFDTECIEDNGSYQQIVQRMVEMAQGSLPLENIKDHVDLEKEEAWFSFTFRGKETRVKCKVQDDWVDSTIFAKFVELLAKSDPNKIFVYYDLGGQDCIIGCIQREELKKLNHAGIKFVPLS